MSPRIGSEAESGSAATARKHTREEDRPTPRLAVAPVNGVQIGAPMPVENIGALTAAELAELSPPEARGVTSGAFSKRLGESQLDWSALRTPTPLPPPPAAEPVIVPSAVQPFYGKLPDRSDRAELRIADLSLDFANPFLGSSLMPPAPSKRPWLKPMLITLGVVVLIGAGYVGAVYHVERHALSAVANWTGAERASAVSIQPQLQAATTEASPASAEIARAAAPVLAPAVASRAHVHEAAHTTPQIVESAQNEASVEQAGATATEPTTSATLATPVAEQIHTARGRRRAARVLAPAPAVSAKVLEEKPAAPSVTTATASPAATRAVAPAASLTARPVAATSQNLQQDLSRTQVQNGLESVRGQLQSCAAGAHGRTTANVTVSGAGRVTYVTIEGAFAGTPQGSCMARALRGAQFPQFATPQLRVRYPFAL
jgi:hypothetical protein